MEKVFAHAKTGQSNAVRTGTKYNWIVVRNVKALPKSEDNGFAVRIGGNGVDVRFGMVAVLKNVTEVKDGADLSDKVIWTDQTWDGTDELAICVPK